MLHKNDSPLSSGKAGLDTRPLFKKISFIWK